MQLIGSHLISWHIYALMVWAYLLYDRITFPLSHLSLAFQKSIENQVNHPVLPQQENKEKNIKQIHFLIIFLSLASW